MHGVPQPQGCFPALRLSRQKVRVQVPPYGCPCHEEPATLVLCSGEASLLHDVHTGWSDTWCSCYFCFLKGARTCFWIPGSGEPPRIDPPDPNDNLSTSLTASHPSTAYRSQPHSERSDGGRAPRPQGSTGIQFTGQCLPTTW